MRVSRRSLGAVVVGVAILAAACGNAERSGEQQGSAERPAGTTAPAGEVREVREPGVTATEIRVGGVASITKPINGPYGDSCKGVQAYFDMVNAQGGVHGRRLRLVACRDGRVELLEGGRGPSLGAGAGDGPGPR